MAELRESVRPGLPESVGYALKRVFVVAVLDARKIATEPVLAEAFGVSLNTVRNALTDAQPVLEDAGVALPDSSRHFRSAAEFHEYLANLPDDQREISDTPTP